MPARRDVALRDYAVISREEFIRHYWDYRPGEHVTWLAPTQWGKTTFANQLLEVTATTKLPAVVLIMKPRDKTVAGFLRTHKDFARVRQWPPSAVERLKTRDARGWVLWPPHTFDNPDQDNDRLYFEFRKAVLDSYKRGNRILVIDELSGITKFLGLEREPQAIYWQGAGMGVGLWGAAQRPAFAPQEAYSQAEHIFIARDPDKRNRDRYREIGGVDPVELEYNLEKCQRYQWVYVKRTGGYACIVDA